MPRLLGWRLDQTRGEMVPMLADPGGRLWSEQLESWLVPDGAFLRLSDRSGQRRLTQAEAEAEARQAEARRAEAEARRADAATRKAEIEAQRAQAEAQRAQALAEKLRSLGVNPDEV